MFIGWYGVGGGYRDCIYAFLRAYRWASWKIENSLALSTPASQLILRQVSLHAEYKVSATAEDRRASHTISGLIISHVSLASL